MALDLDKIVKRAVGLADRFTESMQPTVQHVPVIGRDVNGPVYGDPVDVQAIVEDVGEAVVGSGGVEQLATTKLTFLRPILVTQEDRFVLPDGTEGQVSKKAGPLGKDGSAFLREVWLGKLGVG